MPTHTSRAVTAQATATLAALGLIALLVRVNWITFQYTGFVSAVSLCIIGGGSVLFVGQPARCCRRFLPLPPLAFAALTALLVALTWAFPLTPRTRFFADTSRVRIGMTVNEVRALLPQYPAYCFESPATFPLPPEQAARIGANPHFDGFLEYHPRLGSSDFTRFDTKDGKVIGIFSYASL